MKYFSYIKILYLIIALTGVNNLLFGAQPPAQPTQASKPYAMFINYANKETPPALFYALRNNRNAVYQQLLAENIIHESVTRTITGCLNAIYQQLLAEKEIDVRSIITGCLNSIPQAKNSDPLWTVINNLAGYYSETNATNNLFLPFAQFTIQTILPPQHNPQNQQIIQHRQYLLTTFLSQQNIKKLLDSETIALPLFVVVLSAIYTFQPITPELQSLANQLWKKIEEAHQDKNELVLNVLLYNPSLSLIKILYERYNKIDPRSFSQGFSNWLSNNLLSNQSQINYNNILNATFQTTYNVCLFLNNFAQANKQNNSIFAQFIQKATTLFNQQQTTGTQQQQAQLDLLNKFSIALQQFITQNQQPPSSGFAQTQPATKPGSASTIPSKPPVASTKPATPSKISAAQQQNKSYEELKTKLIAIINKSSEEEDDDDDENNKSMIVDLLKQLIGQYPQILNELVTYGTGMYKKTNLTATIASFCFATQDDEIKNLVIQALDDKMNDPGLSDQCYIDACLYFDKQAQISNNQAEKISDWVQNRPDIIKSSPQTEQSIGGNMSRGAIYSALSAVAKSFDILVQNKKDIQTLTKKITRAIKEILNSTPDPKNLGGSLIKSLQTTPISFRIAILEFLLNKNFNENNNKELFKNALTKLIDPTTDTSTDIFKCFEALLNKNSGYSFDLDRETALLEFFIPLQRAYNCIKNSDDNNNTLLHVYAQSAATRKITEAPQNIVQNAIKDNLAKETNALNQIPLNIYFEAIQTAAESVTSFLSPTTIDDTFITKLLNGARKLSYSENYTKYIQSNVDKIRDKSLILNQLIDNQIFDGFFIEAIIEIFDTKGTSWRYQKDSAGRTPLHHLMGSNRDFNLLYPILTAILPSDLEDTHHKEQYAQQKDNDGNTPLHLFAQYNTSITDPGSINQIFALLNQHGRTETNPINNAGKTLCDLVPEAMQSPVDVYQLKTLVGPFNKMTF